jgi:hemin uptake protein HemP
MRAQIHSPQTESRVIPFNAAPSAPTALSDFSSQALLQGRREILIRHGDSVYRLRHTSNDKLILTK